jgi:hypothetical protein
MFMAKPTTNTVAKSYRLNKAIVGELEDFLQSFEVPPSETGIVSAAILEYVRARKTKPATRR